MKCCAVTIGILCILLILGFAGLKIAQNIGVERASQAQEIAMLHKLNKAKPKEVIKIWFWSINHHSKRVLKECSNERAGWEDIRKIELISVKEIKPENPNEKLFSVRFKVFHRYGTSSQGFEPGMINEWKFYLRQSGKENRWKVVSHGMC